MIAIVRPPCRHPFDDLANGELVRPTVPTSSGSSALFVTRVEERAGGPSGDTTAEREPGTESLGEMLRRSSSQNTSITDRASTPRVRYRARQLGRERHLQSMEGVAGVLEFLGRADRHHAHGAIEEPEHLVDCGGHREYVAEHRERRVEEVGYALSLALDSGHMAIPKSSPQVRRVRLRVPGGSRPRPTGRAVLRLTTEWNLDGDRLALRQAFPRSLDCPEEIRDGSVLPAGDDGVPTHTGRDVGVLHCIRSIGRYEATRRQPPPRPLGPRGPAPRRG